MNIFDIIFEAFSVEVDEENNAIRYILAPRNKSFVQTYKTALEAVIPMIKKQYIEYFEDIKVDTTEDTVIVTIICKDKELLKDSKDIILNFFGMLFGSHGHR